MVPLVHLVTEAFTLAHMCLHGCNASTAHMYMHDAQLQTDGHDTSSELAIDDKHDASSNINTVYVCARRQCVPYTKTLLIHAHSNIQLMRQGCI